MTQYAQFDSSAPGPAPVITWYDTGALVYPNLPDASDLLELTPAEWFNHGSGFWAVLNGQLVSYTPPPPVQTLAQQAQMAMAAGLAIASDSNPLLNALYAVGDAATGSHIQAEMLSILVTGTFADGSEELAWPDMAVNPVNHIFNPVEFQAFAMAVGRFLSALYKVMNGTLLTLPPASADIP